MAFNIRNESARGNCYRAAYAMIDAANDSDCRLCHGIATRTKPPHERMGHAWIEWRGLCFDGLFPSVGIEKERYYRIGNIEADSVQRYAIWQARRLALDNQNYGPWDSLILAAAHANDD